MYQLKNHLLQKAAIALVVAMCLAIPNLNVYSFFGNYGTASQSITINESHVQVQAIRQKKGVSTISKGVGLISAFYGVLTLVSGHKAQTNYALADSNYAKYDFSQFDN